MIIHGKQNVKSNEGSISLKNYSRQISVTFKIYADFECILKDTPLSEEIIDKNTSNTKKYQNYIPCGFAYKVICVDNRFSKDIVVYRRKDAINKFINMILKEYDYRNKILKKCFNKNLIMSLIKKKYFSYLINVGSVINYLIL